MENNIIVNGEIYIKKYPNVLFPTNGKMGTLYDWEFEASKEGASEHNVFLWQMFQDGINDNDTRYDYSHMNNYWLSFVDSNDINMLAWDCISASLYKCKNKEELDKNFMKLTDFLEKAEYIGKYFKRTRPKYYKSTGLINTKGDIGYMKEDSRHLALFKLGNKLLIRTKDLYHEEFEINIIDPRYLDDGNYTFYGNFNKEFEDKKKVYRLIHNQIVGQIKENNSYKR